ncbi:MAG: histone deacetylase family protein [Desulfobacterales bacterium]|nr:histone deacetylase family protein [Desulfobacterales bacterium]
MKVFFKEDFYIEYTSDPAAEKGRMEAIVETIKPHVDFLPIEPAQELDIAAVHTSKHIEYVSKEGLYQISALAAGASIQAAHLGLKEPCFALVRPPGNHASADSSWGFCYFNNMAIAITNLKNLKLIKKAYVLDFDLHYGYGTVNILGNDNNIRIYNPEANSRVVYMENVKKELEQFNADIIGVSAGFDNHVKDWGGMLTTQDYYEIGLMVKNASLRCKAGCFGILEGGYEHSVLGSNVLAFLNGLSSMS